MEISRTKPNIKRVSRSISPLNVEAACVQLFNDVFLYYLKSQTLSSIDTMRDQTRSLISCVSTWENILEHQDVESKKFSNKYLLFSTLK